MSRLKKMSILTAALFGLAAAVSAVQEQPLRQATSTSLSTGQDKPNFLFVMVDDMAPDAIFHDRFDFLETPNLQRMAVEGAVFNNMFVTTSLCGPSRASFLTGTYASRHGVIVNEHVDVFLLRNWLAINFV